MKEGDSESLVYSSLYEGNPNASHSYSEKSLATRSAPQGTESGMSMESGRTVNFGT